MRKKNIRTGTVKIKSDGSVEVEKPKPSKPRGQSGYNLPAGTPTGSTGQ